MKKILLILFAVISLTAQAQGDSTATIYFAENKNNITTIKAQGKNVIISNSHLESIHQVAIYNEQGNLISYTSLSPNDGQVRIDLSERNSGIYRVIAFDNRGNRTTNTIMLH